MGLIFEMPILVFFLAFMGIMTPVVHDQELSLRDSGDIHSGGHRYAHSRHRKHVHFCGAHDGAVRAQHWRGMDGASQAARKRGKRSRRNASDAKSLRGMLLALCALAVVAVIVIRIRLRLQFAACSQRTRAMVLPELDPTCSASAAEHPPVFSSRQRSAACIRRQSRHAIREGNCEVRSASARQRESQESRRLH